MDPCSFEQSKKEHKFSHLPNFLPSSVKEIDNAICN
jgi:hypothetical protein